MEQLVYKRDAAVAPSPLHPVLLTRGL